MMKVLIVAEGKHELSGALQTLVGRLAPMEIQCETDHVKRNDIHIHHGKGKGYFKKAVRWLREAEKRGYDAVVLLIDQDNQPERVQQITQAQEFQTITIRRALGVAIRTFDAWILADEQALAKALGCSVSLQSQPEKQSNPKSICQQLLHGSRQTMSQAELYAEVLTKADLEQLANRCPKGFAPFADRVRSL